MGEKTEMTTKEQRLDKRSNTAHQIIEAASWLDQALDTQNPSLTREYILVALRWLEKTGVADELLPPSIESKRIERRL